MDENLRELNINGTVYKTDLTNKYKNRKSWEAPNLNHILSHIPGKILELFVKEGQEVKKGEGLLILEAMKMKNRIVMPFDGSIKKISVAVGDQVPNHRLMIEIE